MGLTDGSLSIDTAIAFENTSRLATGKPRISDNQVTVLKKMGFTTGEQVSYFNAEIEANPKLKDTFAGFEKDFATTNKYDAVLKKMGAQVLTDGAKIKFDADAAKKSDTGIIDKLAKDLSGANGAQMIKQLREHPDAIVKNLDSYASQKGTVADFLGQPVVTAAPAPVPEKAPSASGSSSHATTGKHSAKAPAPIAVAAAPVTPTVVTPSSAPITQTAPEVTPTTQAPVAKNTPQTPSQDPQEQVLAALAGASDKDIKEGLTKTDVKRILNGMADQAETKFGVNASTASGFKNRVGGGDPKLADDKLISDITINMQNNPDFVRQLAKSAQNKTEPSDGLKEAARKEMTKVMENPEKLAEDSYVKELSQNMKKAESFEAFSSSGIGKMFGSMFGEGFGGKISGWIGQIFEGIKNFFSGLFGGKPVLSMTSGGNSMLPNVMINTRNFQENVDNAAAFARYRPEEMNALPIKGADGKFFHDVVTKDAKGNETKREEPNTITIKTAEGKDMKVIPATGNLMAQQMAGNLGADGRFTEGNVRVPVVTGIDKNGQSAKIESIVMTPAEFNKYKTQVDAEGQKRGGQFQTLDFQKYTVENAIEAEKKPQALQIISVNAKSGAVSEPVETAIGNTPTPLNNRPNPAANDQQYALQNNG